MLRGNEQLWDFTLWDSGGYKLVKVQFIESIDTCVYTHVDYISKCPPGTLDSLF